MVDNGSALWWDLNVRFFGVFDLGLEMLPILEPQSYPFDKALKTGPSNGNTKNCWVPKYASAQ